MSLTTLVISDNIQTRREQAKGDICANWPRGVVPVALHYKENCAKSWVSDVSGILCGVRSEGI